jgi:hypothetical protein
MRTTSRTRRSERLPDQIDDAQDLGAMQAMLASSPPEVLSSMEPAPSLREYGLH